MNLKNISIFTLIILIFTACQAKPAPITHKIEKECQFYSLKTALCETQEQMINSLKPYQVIFIGDHHPEDKLHKNIASLITALSKDGTKVHLASEWFYPSDAPILKKFANKDINETSFLEEIKWKKRLKYNKYESFKPMYQAVINSGGKLYGINLSKEDRKKISDQNLSAMSKEELTFNNSLDLEVNPHKSLVMPFLSFCHAPKKGESQENCIKRMYRVQVAWDSKMAQESYKLSKQLKPNEKLIVFAGSMHLEKKLGIPLRFSRLTNEPFVTIIPANQKTHKVENDIGDYIIFYHELKEK